MSNDNQLLLSKEAYKQLVDLVEELGMKDYSINLSKGINKGDNYLGLIVKSKVEGRNKKGEPVSANFVVKCAQANEHIRKMLAIVSSYQREVYVYEQLFAEFLELQKQINLEKLFFPFAKYFGSSLDAPNEMLILEDMGSHGFFMWNKKIPLDLQHCQLVMRTYGKYHALSLALKDQKPKTYLKLLENTRDGYWNYVDLGRISGNLKAISKNIKKHLDKEVDKALINKLEEFVLFPQNGLLNNLSADAAGEFAVFCHGDCWINNILYKYEDEDITNPTDICILDWQLTKCASPAVDLGYFLFSSTDKTLRAEHYEDLLKIYHSSLCSFLKELGSDSTIFPYQVLLEHMKKFSKYGLMMSLFVVNLMLTEEENIPDLTSESAGEKLKSTFKFISCHPRIIDIVKDFHSLGYFD